MNSTNRFSMEHRRGFLTERFLSGKMHRRPTRKQTNKTLLLSDDATINTKPQLEIFADDVKCTHGATVGQLDDESMFYLRSRGIDLAAARNILTFAFATDVINRITIEPLHQQLEKLIQSRLNKNYTSSDMT